MTNLQTIYSASQKSITRGGEQCLRASQRALSNIKIRANKKTARVTTLYESPAQLLTIIFHHFLRNPLSSAGIFLNERKSQGRGAVVVGCWYINSTTRRDFFFSFLSLASSPLLFFFNSRSMTSNEIDPDLYQDHPLLLFLIATSLLSIHLYILFSRRAPHSSFPWKRIQQRLCN